MNKLLGFSCALAIAGVAGVVWASPPSGVTPTLIGRGTYDAFKVKTGPDSPIEIDAKAKDPLDIVVRMHSYAPGSSTGWHMHPGPVFITVLQGEVTFYEYDDPTCTPKVVPAGEGYVDDGHGHIGLNQTGQTALDISVILAPVGGVFRSELNAPGPYCSF